ncbi:MAG TPA: hypothetical protein VFZ68_10240, partial [Acidimicrobiales bacterium]
MATTPGRQRSEPAGPAGHDRRAFLRALGLGATGVSIGGMGWLAACNGGGGSSDRTGGRAPSEGATGTVPAYDPSRRYWEQGNFAPVTTEETL